MLRSLRCPRSVLGSWGILHSVTQPSSRRAVRSAGAGGAGAALGCLLPRGHRGQPGSAVLSRFDLSGSCLYPPPSCHLQGKTLKVGSFLNLDCQPPHPPFPGKRAGAP